MQNIHIVIPDLFLPSDVAAQVCNGLELPALETMLARAQAESLQTATLEAWLCEAFGMTGHAIAAVTLQADGMEPGDYCWLRADPVHLHLQRDQMILQAGLPLDAEEAAQLCASLNTHFAEAGLRFFAPHPQRWYLRLGEAPDIVTRPLSQVAGKNIHPNLPQGPDALKWHGVLNEIQMLIFDHPVNQARESRGELPVNSVWLWGEGRAAKQLAQRFNQIHSDSELAVAFAQVAGISCNSDFSFQNSLVGKGAERDGDTLIVWEGLRAAIQQGDLQAWRTSLRRFEQNCAAPLLAALRGGRIKQITLDVLDGHAARRFVLTRGEAWKLWRRPKSLAGY